MTPFFLCATIPPKSGQFLDMVLYQTALHQGKQVLGLETIEEQLGIFETLSEADQITLLRETLDNRHLFPELFQELTEAYLQRNLKGLMKLNADYAVGGDTDLAQHLNERMVDNRNQTMVDRLPEDFRRADRLAGGLRGIPGCELAPDTPHTNMVYLRLGEDAPHNSADQVCDILSEKGIKVGVFGPRSFRLVTHYWINDAAVDRVLEAFNEIMSE